MSSTFIVEVLFVCPSDNNIVDSVERTHTVVNEELAVAVWAEILDHRATFSCPCGDVDTHTVEINVTSLETGDAMGTTNPRSETEVDTFFKDDWFA